MSRKQGKLFDEVNDPPLVRAVEKVIELREEKKSVTEKLEAQEAHLIGLMQKARKAEIHHAGYVIQIKLSETKTKITLKQENPAKTKKVEDSTRRGKDDVAQSAFPKEREN